MELIWAFWYYSSYYQTGLKARSEQWGKQADKVEIKIFTIS